MQPSNLRASNWSGTVVRVMLTVALGVTAAAIVRGDIPSGMDGTSPHATAPTRRSRDRCA